MTAPLLEVEDLALEIDSFDGRLQVLDGVSFTVAPGDTLGLVGETGCGKSITAKAVLGLVPSPPARITRGDVRYRGRSLVGLSAAGWRAIRGTEIAMIFQDPMTFLNPLLSVGRQMLDAVLGQNRARPPARRLDRAGAKRRALEMLAKVHLPDPERVFEAHPFALSGGQRQRVLIAMALAGEPKLLLADEPTTALDVTVQAQVLELLRELVETMDLAVVLISHDLGVVAKVCRRIGVMYAGRVVEEAATADLFERPTHPYTQGLMAAIPRLDRPDARCVPIPGSIPDLLDPPTGCRFHPRCPHRFAPCASRRPPDVALGDDHRAACFLPEGAAREGAR